MSRSADRWRGTGSNTSGRSPRRRPDRPINILTHCNAGWLAAVDWGTATAPIYAAHEAGLPVHVFVDETRPRNQGAALTAWELGQHGVPHTVVVDSLGGHLMQHGMVDCVIVGTDRTTASGDVCNKVGTYLKALAAHANNVPFYVAAPSPSIDFGIDDGVAGIHIEQRSPEEVTHISGACRGWPDRAHPADAGREPGAELRLRRDAGASRHRTHHRARRRSRRTRRRSPPRSRSASRRW